MSHEMVFRDRAEEKVPRCLLHRKLGVEAWKGRKCGRALFSFLIPACPHVCGDLIGVKGSSLQDVTVTEYERLKFQSCHLLPSMVSQARHLASLNFMRTERNGLRPITANTVKEGRDLTLCIRSVWEGLVPPIGSFRCRVIPEKKLLSPHLEESKAQECSIVRHGYK